MVVRARVFYIVDPVFESPEEQNKEIFLGKCHVGGPQLLFLSFPKISSKIINIPNPSLFSQNHLFNKLVIDYFAKISLSSNFQRQRFIYKNLHRASKNLTTALDYNEQRTSIILKAHKIGGSRE